MPTIESNDLTVSDVFKDFYTVPDYQREFVWGEDEVDQLLTDISDELAEGNNAEYFIGSIVTCPGSQSRLDLIDGQQRMTTLFVALCAIRDRLKALGDQKLGSIKRLIADEKTDAAGHDTFETRILLQYEDAGNVLDILTSEQELPRNGPTRSIANIIAAYQTAMDFFIRKYTTDTEALRKFYGYLINNVKLIRIKTDSLARALKIFETINDRGVGLDAMDLLKNLLFRKAQAQEFEKLKVGWKGLVDSLYRANEKPLRFLRYFILSSYGIEKLREDELYDWLVNNEKKVGFAANPVGFVEILNDAVRAYVNFLRGLTSIGERNPDVEALALLSGKATRQQLIVLLAARSLDPEIFSAVCRDLERLILVYLVARQNNREFEVMFPGWAVEVIGLSSLKEYAEFSDKTFRKRRNELADRFLREFAALNTKDFKRYQLRYLVGKLTQAVDMAGFGPNAEGTRWLSRYCDPVNHIEHIAPTTPSEDAINEFGEEATNAAIQWSVGNLALAEASINGSLGNKPFSKKKPVYPQSQFLLTRTISGNVKVGKDTAINRAIENLVPFDQWHAGEVRKRSEMLASLASKVWDVST